MKVYKLGLLMAVGGFLLVSPAGAATHEWRGGGFLDYLTQACADEGWPDREYVSARFRPRTLGDNGPHTRISFFHPLFVATSFVRENANFAKSFKPVVGAIIGAGPGINTTDVKLKATTTPTSVKPATQTVRLVGEIRNYANTPGCNVGFDVSLTKRP